jgi:hypothetical protein
VRDQTLDSLTDDHDEGRADYFGADKSGVLSDPAWRSISADPVLSRPPTPGSSGNVPVGDDLRLDIGWDRFEQLLVFVAQGVLGLNQVRFRRYGVSGQAQYGIDLAGRGSDGGYTVVQCKEYDIFTPADLRAAVAKRLSKETSHELLSDAVFDSAGCGTRWLHMMGDIAVLGSASRECSRVGRAGAKCSWS